ncbi:MAG TPA: hypothetical protein VKU90_15825 [Caulobacteraceae bacterium]|nr:hypothetical protein [Caulobacteraceae bacterium]
MQPSTTGAAGDAFGAATASTAVGVGTAEASGAESGLEAVANCRRPPSRR